MIKKHHTPAYIKNRLKQIWFEKMNPEAPWLTKDAIQLLDQLIKNDDIGLEFGSGRSTKWLCERCNYLYSVENNQEWFNIVNDDISNRNNVKYVFGQVNNMEPEKSEYISIIESLEDNSIDFILNDGKIRDIVAIKTLRLLKKGGLYILDNAERYLINSLNIPASIGLDDNSMSPEWIYFKELTDSWRRIWTTNGVSSTLILFKP